MEAFLEANYFLSNLLTYILELFFLCQIFIFNILHLDLIKFNFQNLKLVYLFYYHISLQPMVKILKFLKVYHILIYKNHLNFYSIYQDKVCQQIHD